MEEVILRHDASCPGPAKISSTIVRTTVLWPFSVSRYRPVMHGLVLDARQTTIVMTPLPNICAGSIPSLCLPLSVQSALSSRALGGCLTVTSKNVRAAEGRPSGIATCAENSTICPNPGRSIGCTVLRFEGRRLSGELRCVVVHTAALRGRTREVCPNMFETNIIMAEDQVVHSQQLPAEPSGSQWSVWTDELKAHFLEVADQVDWSKNSVIAETRELSSQQIRNFKFKFPKE